MFQRPAPLARAIAPPCRISATCAASVFPLAAATLAASFSIWRALGFRYPLMPPLRSDATKALAENENGAPARRSTYAPPIWLARLARFAPAGRSDPNRYQRSRQKRKRRPVRGRRYVASQLRVSVSIGFLPLGVCNQVKGFLSGAPRGCEPARLSG